MYSTMAPDSMRVRSPSRMVGALDEYGRYLQWVHFAEGSLMPVLVQVMRASGLFGGAPSPELADLRATSDRYLDFVEGELAGRSYFAGEAFTAADIMMGYDLSRADRVADLARLPNISAYRARIAERSAYRKAMAIANPPA